jgi:betaine lipid synthase
VSHKRSADPTRQLGWLMRWFWSMWFDLDNIYLHPSRRDYLEHCFKTVKSLNCKNNFIRPLIKIPYYIWLGAQKNGNMPMFDLDLKENVEVDDSESAMSAEEDSGTCSTQKSNMEKPSHVVSSEHIHGQGLRWRQPFDVNLIPRFNTYIYAFTWEDPLVDLQFLDLKKEDHMMVISSGGCNVLEYAIQVGPARYLYFF